MLSRERKAWKIRVAGIGKRIVGDDGFGQRLIDILVVVHMHHNMELRDLGMD